MSVTTRDSNPLGLLPSVLLSAAERGKLDRVAEYDFWFVEERLRAEGGPAAEDVAGAILGFRRYVALRLMGFTGYPVPSKSIDAVWHTFLLFTREYRAFCRSLGQFIHHVPFTSRSPAPPPPTVPYAVVFRRCFGQAGLLTDESVECGGCGGGGSTDDGNSDGGGGDSGGCG